MVPGLDIDSFHNMLEELSEEIPEALFRELNGGIVTLPEARIHAKSGTPRLYTMGEYRVQIPGLGRYIAIFYGSFMRVYGANPNPRTLRRELRKTLLHEFRHHMESLAGERDLEIIDKQKLQEYMNVVEKNSDFTAD